MLSTEDIKTLCLNVDQGLRVYGEVSSYFGIDTHRYTLVLQYVYISRMQV